MLTITKDMVMPTAITGSYPRPLWYDVSLRGQSFKTAMGDSLFREQYLDAVAAVINAQEAAGLDIVTDGDARFDTEVAGYSWFSYALTRLGGVSFEGAYGRPVVFGRLPYPRGHILNEGMEARVNPTITGPVSRGTLQYTPLWLTAQRMTLKPVKFGTITAELVALTLRDKHYKTRRERILAVAEVLHEELVELAEAGCPVIQMEEPQVHLIGPRGGVDAELTPDFFVEVFNTTVRGLRDKTELWCHTCWGNPAQQRMFARPQSYEPALEALNRIDCDVITFETCASDGMDLAAIGKRITGKKIAIGVIDHHTLQVETPEDVATLIRRALEHIPRERLVIASDCGMGREGMSRRHAFFKMVALVQGTNIVRRELGAKEAPCLAADERFSLLERK
jgi:5-methyltetrahydropteroyltriglutamate--homocysteine methyltransferase